MEKKQITIRNPVEGIEYTFVFSKNNVKFFRTYIFCGKNEKGRLILMETKHNYFTTMTPGWFRSLCRNQLVSTKEAKVVEESPVEEKISPEIQSITAKSPNEMQFELKIHRLRNVAPTVALAIQEKTRLHPNDIANKLERAYKYTGELTYAYIKQLWELVNTAEDIMSGKIKMETSHSKTVNIAGDIEKADKQITFDFADELKALSLPLKTQIMAKFKINTDELADELVKTLKYRDTEPESIRIWETANIINEWVHKQANN